MGGSRPRVAAAAAPVHSCPMTTPDQPRELRLSTPVEELPRVLGVNLRRGEATRFAKLGVVSVTDLLRHLPTRYEREAAETPIGRLTVDNAGTARGTVVTCRYVQAFGRGRGGVRGRFEATVRDDTGLLQLTWFNAPYLRDRIHPGMLLRVQGKVVHYRNNLQIVNPKWVSLSDPEAAPLTNERLRPVYPATADLPSWRIEAIVAGVLDKLLPLVKDPLPADLAEAHGMPALADAYRMAHRPADEGQTLAARRRLAFNELLLLQLGVALKRHYNRTALQAPVLRWSEAVDEHIRQRFSFAFTGAQRRVTQEIAADLQKPVPMNRLLQGDVGSGKTAVALYAMLMAVADRKQAALLAPTELLAEQHYASIEGVLRGGGIRSALLTASASAPGTPQRRAIVRQIEGGEIDIVVGTQAMLGEGVVFGDLAVVVIDEQHRFGVAQRAVFRDPRKGVNAADPVRLQRPVSPHHLVMTATPIPRTLGLTLFGDLDVSTLDELPPGRAPILTKVVPPDKCNDVYDYLATRLGRGEQAYVVVPSIDEAGGPPLGEGDEGEGGGAGKALKSVRAHAAMLQERLGSAYRVAAVHGQLKRNTREAIMHRFRGGSVHVLVATTVIEVGVDVPNASVMIVEHAERFGLAQLHQLRGRVGRSSDGRRALCVLIAEPTTEDAKARLDALAGTTDGFVIAEKDLAIRGMGEFFGTRQSGSTPLRVARIPDDLDLLRLAGRDAEAMIAADPTLSDPRYATLRKLLITQYGDALGLVDVG